MWQAQSLCAFEVSVFLFEIRTKDDFVRDFLIFVCSLKKYRVDL
jgi:hypothetical protein